MQITPALKSEGFFLGDNFGYRVFPTSNQCDVQETPVLIVHGFPSHTTKNHDLACKLALNGYGSYVVHHAGLGESLGKFSFTNAVKKVTETIELICNIHGVEGIHLVGHSFGGLAALSQTKHIESLSLLCPLFETFTDDKILDDFSKATWNMHKELLSYRDPSEISDDVRELSKLYPQDLLTKNLSNVGSLIIHGFKDDVIPVESSRKLSAFQTEHSIYQEIKDDHRFSLRRPEVLNMVQDFICSL